MPTIVIKRCPKCHVPYEADFDSRGLGQPFRACQLCRQIIIDTDTTEWELKSLPAKVGYLVICLWSSLLVGLLLPIAVLVYRELTDQPSMGNELFVRLLAVGVLLAAAVMFLGTWKEIQESKERMKNEPYRAVLRQLGLLKT